jgi:hypothetical protein
MLEDRFPGYQIAYRQLCKEKVKFPPRNTNIRMLMEQYVKDSPMYDHIEQLCNKQNYQQKQESVK